MQRINNLPVATKVVAGMTMGIITIDTAATAAVKIRCNKVRNYKSRQRFLGFWRIVGWMRPDDAERRGRC